ncbi:protein of unknown function [Methylocaldum szegediense]|uniref:Uncharacterized protein n=1 Tax=Methylocaldum szegediense TaxID=73780 RepID=A0ABM9I2V2_9GAMM|nr:protein of unknown function [Methylocaldum szegediense]
MPTYIFSLPTLDALLGRADHTPTDRRKCIKDEISGFDKDFRRRPRCLLVGSFDLSPSTGLS